MSRTVSEGDRPVTEKEPKGRFRMTRRRMILGGTLMDGALIVGYGVTHPMDVGGAFAMESGVAIRRRDDHGRYH